MKTSNKILSTAFAAYLLFTAGNSAAILKEYKRAEASGKALITQLEKTSIHVLSVEGDNYIQASRGRKSSQTLGFWSPFDPETTPLRICGDTLYISGTSYGYVTLPDLKSFLRNGKPQPIYRGENETYIEASAENSGSVLYDKEIRDKPRTRRTKRNV